MANKVQKPCRTCGKMFTPCADCENDNTMFRWKKVACSPECAKLYFAKIEASRQPKVEIPNVHNLKETDMVSENVAVIESIKPRRTRKKNEVKNEESEQID